MLVLSGARRYWRARQQIGTAPLSYLQLLVVAALAWLLLARSSTATRSAPASSSAPATSPAQPASREQHHEPVAKGEPQA